jgi:hypothetical protein
VDELVRRLYVLPPDEFIAARTEAVRAAADRARAEEIGRLRRPTVAAWLVNLLAIQRPQLLAELDELATALRSAQRELRGDELRALSGQRRAVISALVEEARRLAVATKPALGRSTNLPLGEVEATLQAALADAEAARLVRSGRLVRTIEYAGFGEVPRPQLRLVTGGNGADEPAEASADDRRRQGQRQLVEARTAEVDARTALDRANEAERDGAREVAELEAALAEIQQRRVAAEEELSRRKLARKAAERALAAARRRVGDAEAALEHHSGTRRGTG